MAEIKILVTKIPDNPAKCPFAVWNCEYGYLCSLARKHERCELHRHDECNRLVAPLTFNSGEE